MPRICFLTVISCCFLLALTGCSSSKKPNLPIGGASASRPPLEAPSDVERAPWELWNYGQDLTGVSIRSEEIRQGDEALKRGDYDTGLRAYATIITDSLSAADQDALVARIASAQIALGHYNKALDGVSKYFAKKGVGAEAVNGQYALILAYGYGALGDYDQSLAWFARTDATPSPSPMYSNAALRGARLLITSIPEVSFEDVYSRWKDDRVFAGLLARERSMRQSPEYRQQVMAQTGATFWRRQLTPQQTQIVEVDEVKIDKAVVGVVLPLSGPFAPLGQGTKNGMDIALEVEQEPRIQVLYRDYQGDVGLASNAARDLVKTDKVNVIVGPLLSEPANAVREIALQSRTPEVSLSKGNSFAVGDIVFRLGATSNSQADTLLEACSQLLSMTKFAVVYPENQVGLEYATAFKKYINLKGLELVYEATYRHEDVTKLSTIASELERLQVDGVFFPDSLSKAQDFFALFSESFRDRVRPLGPATWDDPVQLANSQAIFKGAVFVSPFFHGSTNPLVSRFIQLYTQKFGKKPDFLAAQGFDAMTLVVGALRSMMTTGGSFELAFKDIESYDGLTGAMRVDVSGEVQRNYVVVEARDGELRAVKALPTQSQPPVEGLPLSR